MMTLKDLAVEHDYYASESNFYSNDAAASWKTWAEFYEEYQDADIDYNLVYRWDIKRKENSERCYMEVFFIRQRKGIYAPQYIGNVYEKDVETIIPFMKKHWEKLQSIWNPISKGEE